MTGSLRKYAGLSKGCCISFCFYLHLSARLSVNKINLTDRDEHSVLKLPRYVDQLNNLDSDPR